MIGWLRTDWGKYCSILVIWAAFWYFPQPLSQFDFYGSNFHLLQAINPLFLIFIVFQLTNAWWRKELGIILVLQIFHNLGDVFLDSPWYRYDQIQSVLNALELFILLGFGLPTLIYDAMEAKRKSRDSRRADNNPDARHRVKQSQQGIQGHAR